MITTIDELEAIEKEYLVPSQVAGILGCSPYTINIAAREAVKTGRNQLGFPVILCGTRVRIPKRAFIKFMKGA